MDFQNLFDIGTHIPTQTLSINRKLLKPIFIYKRAINTHDTNIVSRYVFSLESDFAQLSGKHNQIIISQIPIKKFMLNITPNGLKEVSKSEFIGVEEAKQRQKVLQDERERKERNKNDPGKELVPGPGER